MNRLKVLAFMLVVSICCVAQVNYHGLVVSENGQSVPFANVMVLQSADSTFLAGATTDSEGKFEVQSPSSGMLKVTCIGYADKMIANPKTQEKIVLSPEAILLNEVTVKAQKPVTHISGDALVTTVKGTILQDIGTASDVLGHLPGVLNNQGSIEVFGKGTPAIYINGRLMRNANELEQLKSDKILKVEVVSNPGARYDATVNSVIRIFVEKNVGDGWGLDNTLTMGYGDYLYGKELLNLNYRSNSLDVFANLEYDNKKQKGSSENVQNTWLANAYKQEILMASKTRTQLYNGKVGLNYTFSPYKSMGFFYEISHTPIKKNTWMSTQTWVDEVLESTGDIAFHSDNKTTNHLVDGYFTSAFGKWTFDATVDAFWKTTDVDDLSQEVLNKNENRTITSSSNAAARMFAGEMNFSRMLGKGQLSFGMECTYSRREDDFVNQEAVLVNNNAKVKETNAALYAQWMQKVGIVTFQVGLRYEHVNSNYYEYGKKIDEQSRVYDKVFPSALMVMPLGKTSMVQLSYSRKCNRPLYSQLSSTVQYVNRYLYQSGNPLLRPSYSDHISANFKYSWLMLMASYSHTSDRIISSFEQYNGDNDITLIKKSNSPYSMDNIQVMASLQPRFGIYYPALACGFLAQFYKIDYCGEKKSFNHPMPIVRFNNMLQLSKTTLLNADFIWRGKGDQENIQGEKATWGINLGYTQVFNKHWRLKLAANDIFNGSRTNQYMIYSGLRSMFLAKHVNTRSVECTLRYMFNVTKSKYRGQGAGGDERKRL